MHSLKKEPSWKEEGPTQNIKDCILEVQNKSEVIIVSEVSYFNNALISKDCIDRVDSINAKTSTQTEVFTELRDTTPEQKNDVDSHILAHGRFSRKQEIVMSEKTEINYSKRPNCLSDHPAFRCAKLKHRLFFLELLSRITFKEKVHYIMGNKIILKKNQYCASYQQLAEELSYECRWKEDKFTVADVRGAINYFQRSRLLTQDLTHGKSIITVLYSEICEEKESTPNTGSNIDLTQTSHTKEEDKEDNIEKERSPLSPKKIQEVKSKSDTKKQKESQADQLAGAFLESIKKFKPNFTKSVSPKWIKEFEKILKHRSMEEIVRIIELTHEDSFWKTVVLSPESLWRNLDQIESRINEKKEKTTWKTKKKSDKCNQNSSDSSTPELILVPLSSRMNTEKKSWNGSGE